MGDDAVGEPGGQGEHPLRVGDQRAVPEGVAVSVPVAMSVIVIVIVPVSGPVRLRLVGRERLGGGGESPDDTGEGEPAPAAVDCLVNSLRLSGMARVLPVVAGCRGPPSRASANSG